ncbi:MAG: response regulator [Nitrospirae bacterium]|nr:response regulator [Nitrospirota bacterium]
MKKILIVDDLRPFVEEEKNILSRSDVQIFTASSGQEALSLHKNVKADLMVIDLEMPGMTGDELCSTIRRAPDLKFVSVLMVTRPRENDIARCRICGANDYVTKPIKPDILLEKAINLLGVAVRKAYRVFVNISVEGEKGQVKFTATTVNISTTGFLIETRKALNIGDVVHCSFFLMSSATISVMGEIVRTIKKPASDVKQYGIKFTDISDAGRRTIEEFIKSRSAPG